jgi:hypothetical protein
MRYSEVNLKKRHCDTVTSPIVHLVFCINHNILYKTIEDIHVEHQAKITQLVPDVMGLRLLTIGTHDTGLPHAVD